MRALKLIATLVLLAAPLAAQHIAASNQSDKTPLNPLAVWEEARAVIIQAEGLHDALSSGDYDLNISADACLSIWNQQRSGLPPALPDPIPTLGSNTAECEVLLSEDYVKQALHGWHYNFPASTGADNTVCASGCDFTNLETAIAAAACGDTVTVTANETVNRSGDVITVAKHCSQAAPLWVRTSAHASLVSGVRVSPSDASLMPKFTGTNGNARIIDVDQVSIAISSVDTGTDTLTMTSPHGLSVGDKVFFTTASTQPLSDTRPYWVLTVPTTTTLTVSKFEKDGATLDLTGTATGSLVLPSQWIRFTGFYLMPNASGDSSGAMVDTSAASGGAYQPDARPNHIWFDHFLIESVFNQEQRRAFNAIGRYFAYTDSYVAGIMDNADCQAIWVNSAMAGPLWAENNHLEASGENVMIGGSPGANLHLNPASHGAITFKGNHFYKPLGEWKITQDVNPPGSATPTQVPCIPGEWWTDTTGPDHYRCNGTGDGWDADAGPPIEIAMSLKNNFEIKKVERLTNFGNVYEGNHFDAQDGMLINLKQAEPSQNGPNATMRNVILYGEIGKSGSAAIQIASLSSDEIQRASGNLLLGNLLIHDIDPVLYDSYHDGGDGGTAIDYGSTIRVQNTNLGVGGVAFRHVTLLPRLASETVAATYLPSASSALYYLDPLTIADSILTLTDVKASGVISGCSSFTAATTTLAIGANAWIWSDGAGPDLTSCSTAYYGETSPNSIGFASWSGGTEPDDFRITSAGATRDYRAGQAQDASDGKDMGADIDIVKDLTAGTETGLLSWSEQFGVAITAVGSTTAAVEWDRPNVSNSCDLTLYTDYARTAEHGDTNTAGEKLDSNRDVTAGHVTFTLGTNSVLTTKTWYWFEIDCATDSVKMVGSLMTN